MTKTNTINNMIVNREWKSKNREYLSELQSFLDKAENIKNEELKKDIIIQMIKCDEKLTMLAEEKFIEYYEKGYKGEEF